MDPFGVWRTDDDDNTATSMCGYATIKCIQYNDRAIIVLRLRCCCCWWRLLHDDDDDCSLGRPLAGVSCVRVCAKYCAGQQQQQQPKQPAHTHSLDSASLALHNAPNPIKRAHAWH